MVEWQTGTPKKPGSYVVAIAYKSGLGTVGAASWDADHGWSLKDDDIVAYIPVMDLLKHANLGWPEHLNAS